MAGEVLVNGDGMFGRGAWAGVVVDRERGATLRDEPSRGD